MTPKEIPFNADDLVASVESVADHLTGRKKTALRVIRVKTPKPAPALTAAQVKAVRGKLKVSQTTFAALLNVPPVTAISWEKGRRSPSGAALRLLQIALKHPEVLVEK
jgi:putative transcriptional regulator